MRQREKRHWGRSGEGDQGRRPVLRAGQLTRKSTPTPRDWLGHARWSELILGCCQWALLLLRLPGRQDTSLEPWGHLGPHWRDPPARKPRLREAELCTERDWLLTFPLRLCKCLSALPATCSSYVPE